MTDALQDIDKVRGHWSHSCQEQGFSAKLTGGQVRQSDWSAKLTGGQACHTDGGQARQTDWRAGGFAQGEEPRYQDPESCVLPLDDSPVKQGIGISLQPIHCTSGSLHKDKTQNLR